MRCLGGLSHHCLHFHVSGTRMKSRSASKHPSIFNQALVYHKPEVNNVILIMVQRAHRDKA